MNPLIVLAVALIACATALFTTPYVRRLALNVGMLDATGERRMHDQPKPRIGGIAVYLGFAFALFSALGYLIQTKQFGDLANLHDVVGLIFGGTLILMVGIWDDVSGCRRARSCSRRHAEIALILAALAGGALGFLRFNWNPAQIILGDSGALFIGYVFATVSIIGGSKQAFAISLLVPLVVLALPVLDTAAAIVRRTRAGKKFYEADRGHFHHQFIFRFGLNVRQAVLLIYAVCIALGLFALFLTSGYAPLRGA